MMDLPLINVELLNFNDVMFLLKSSLRSMVLICLFNNNLTLKQMNSKMKKPPASILHALKELESKGLVVKRERSFYLTSKGYLYSLNLIKLFENWYSFERNIDFWSSHLIDSIPIEFIQSFYLLSDSEYIHSQDIDLSKPLNNYLDCLKDSKTMNIILPVFSDVHLDTIFDKVKKGSKLNLIATPNVLQSFRKFGYMKKLFDLVDKYEISLWRYEKGFNIFLTCCENFMSLSLFFEDGHYDDSVLLLNENEEAILWAKYLFDYYLSKSVKIIL